MLGWVVQGERLRYRDFRRTGDGWMRTGWDRKGDISRSPKSTLLVGFEADEMGWVM